MDIFCSVLNCEQTKNDYNCNSFPCPFSMEWKPPSAELKHEQCRTQKKAIMDVLCFYVVTIKWKHHLDVTMLSYHEVALLDFVIFHLGSTQQEHRKVRTETEISLIFEAWYFLCLRFASLSHVLHPVRHQYGCQCRVPSCSVKHECWVLFFLRPKEDNMPCKWIVLFYSHTYSSQKLI